MEIREKLNSIKRYVVKSWDEESLFPYTMGAAALLLSGVALIEFEKQGIPTAILSTSAGAAAIYLGYKYKKV